MSRPRNFTINLTQQIPDLGSNAPIVEAAIHWCTHVTKVLEPQAAESQTRHALPDYPNIRPIRRLQFEAKVSEKSFYQEDQWRGLWLETEDGRNIGQFTNDGCVFSRLAPYINWKMFEQEAIKLWNVYKDLTHPSEVGRLGVRFINQISCVGTHHLDEIMTLPPNRIPNLDFPIEGFLHQYVYDVPGYPYKLRILQTLQPPMPGTEPGHRLILDIDVFTSHVEWHDASALQEQLQEMRWLKNNAFINLLTQSEVTALGG